MRVLLVEDDEPIARSLTEALTSEGYDVDLCTEGPDAWFMGDTETYTAVILDLGLPGMDGMTVLRKWRSGNNALPVMVLSARGNWSDRVAGIDAGADDYLPKPFHIEELLARLRAIIRRHHGQAGDVIRAGGLEVDLARRQVRAGDVQVDITPQEFRCLAILAQSLDRAVSRAELGELLYGGHGAENTNAVDVLISRLRRRLGRECIVTERGFGYRLAG